jgi:phosphoribosylglycinamide formyltransferase-1
VGDVVGVLASGEGSNLQALLDAGVPVAAVASSARGARALDRATTEGIPVAAFPLEEYPDRDARDTAMAAWLVGHGVTLVVCAGFMQLLRPHFLERFSERVVNVHPSLLPQFPGVHPIEDALASGVHRTGATVHLVDEGVDSGRVLRQEAVAVHADDTAATLRARIQEVEHRLLPAVVMELLGT